jgi:exosortase H (IPTLxxWG-CTERM-specific)
MLDRRAAALVFLMMMVVGGAVLLTPTLQEGPLTSLSIVITETSEWSLHALRVSVAREGRTLYAPGGTFGMRVDNDCNGAWAHLVFLAGVLAYPAGWRTRLLGAAIGTAALFVLNLVRVVSLFLIGVHAPDLFRVTHVWIWQFLVIGFALLLFVVWVDTFVDRTAS